jgi:hypothetical protein
MRLARVTAAAMLVIGLAAFAGNARPGPDPPPGKFSFGISVNDGSDPNVPAYVGLGDECVYPVWNGSEWEMEIRGWASLPAPNSTPASWQVGSYGQIVEASAPATATFTSHGAFGPHGWTGPGTVYWVIRVNAGWGGPPATVYGFPPGGAYEVPLYLNVKTPTTGAWWTAGTGKAQMAW